MFRTNATILFVLHAGWIADMTGSYKPAFFTAGAFTTAGACLLFLLPLLLPPEVEKEWKQRTNSVRLRVDLSNLISICKIGKRNSEYGNRYEETVKMMVDRRTNSENSSRTGDNDTEVSYGSEKSDIGTEVAYFSEAIVATKVGSKANFLSIYNSLPVQETDV